MEEWVIKACANLYREMIKLQVAAPTVDEMELWQIASYFNDGDKPVEVELENVTDPERFVPVPGRKRNLAAERIAAFRAGLDPNSIEVDPTEEGAVLRYLTTGQV